MIMRESIDVYLLCSGVLVLHFFVLSAWVSALRGGEKIMFGHGSQELSPLHRAVRAHGNAAEYLGLIVAIFLYWHLAGAAEWVAWTACAVTLARLLHATGLWLSPGSNRPHVLRVVGTMVTYAGGFALGLALLVGGR